MFFFHVHFILVWCVCRDSASQSSFLAICYSQIRLFHSFAPFPKNTFVFSGALYSLGSRPGLFIFKNRDLFRGSLGASAGTRTQNNGSVDRRDIHFTTNAY